MRALAVVAFLAFASAFGAQAAEPPTAAAAARCAEMAKTRPADAGLSSEDLALLRARAEDLGDPRLVVLLDKEAEYLTRLLRLLDKAVRQGTKAFDVKPLVQQGLDISNSLTYALAAGLHRGCAIVVMGWYLDKKLMPAIKAFRADGDPTATMKLALETAEYMLLWIQAEQEALALTR